MISGVRLTQLANGEPLLGFPFYYKELEGIDAVEKRLDDLFFTAYKMGFDFIIDTIKPTFDNQGNLTFDNNGNYGYSWSIERRLELYRTFSDKYNLNILLEVEFPETITEDNAVFYGNYFLNTLLSPNQWIKYWQILILPEEKINGKYKCSPNAYVKLMKQIYPVVKINYSGIQIGGPGCFSAFVEYTKGKHDGWLGEAIGKKFTKDSQFDSIGAKGFLDFIDFFSIQGTQNTVDFNYNNFGDCIDLLRVAIVEQFGKEIPIFATKQGWKASHDNQTELKQQGYYEIREILNCFKKNVIPFKNQLVDEYFDVNAYETGYDQNKLDYGLLYYFLGDSGNKPASYEYQLILNLLKDFNKIEQDNIVISKNDNVDSVTLLNKYKNEKVTIIWPNTYNKESVILSPHYNRTYIYGTLNRQKIEDYIQINFDENYFLIVFEKIDVVATEIVEVENLVDRKVKFFKSELEQLYKTLPPRYPKETIDTNIYRLLRGLTFEFSDVSVEIEQLKNNIYIDSVENDRLYNNFGALVNLRKRFDWSNAKYRNLVTGITKSFLSGPTKESIKEAVELFTNFDIKIHELYKDAQNVDKSIIQGINPKFAFLVEVEKPIDEIGDQESILKDVQYVVKITKPAHTIYSIIITIVGKENYREQFYKKHNILFENSDKLQRDYNTLINENIFGWRYNYFSNFKTNTTNLNSSYYIGPKYTLHDIHNSILEETKYETMDEVKDKYEIIFDLYQKNEEFKHPTEDYEFNVEEINADTYGWDLNDLLITSDPTTWTNEYKTGLSKKTNDQYFFATEFNFYENFSLGNTLDVLQFTVNTLNKRFIQKRPDQLFEFSVLCKEYTFKKRLVKIDGKTVELDRLGELLDVLIENNEHVKHPIEKLNSLEEFNFSEKEILPRTHQYLITNITSDNDHKTHSTKRIEHYDFSTDYCESIYKKILEQKVSEMFYMFNEIYKTKNEELSVDYIHTDEYNVFKQSKNKLITNKTTDNTHIVLGTKEREQMHIYAEAYDKIEKDILEENYFGVYIDNTENYDVKLESFETDIELTGYDIFSIPSDEFVCEYCNLDEYSFIITDVSQQDIEFYNKEKIKPIEEHVVFEGNPYNEIVKWRILDILLKQDDFKVNFDLFEKYNVKSEKATIDFFEVILKEKIKPIYDVPVFHKEITDIYNLPVLDQHSIDGQELFEKYNLKNDNYFIGDSSFNLSEKYLTKEDKFVAEFFMKDLYDLFKSKNIKDMGIPEYILFDQYMAKYDSHEKFAILVYKDLYLPKKEQYKNDLQLYFNNKYSFKNSVVEYGYEVSDFYNLLINERFYYDNDVYLYDNLIKKFNDDLDFVRIGKSEIRTLQENYKSAAKFSDFTFGNNQFLDVPIINRPTFIIDKEEKYKTNNVKAKLTQIDTRLSEDYHIKKVELIIDNEKPCIEEDYKIKDEKSIRNHESENSETYEMKSVLCTAIMFKVQFGKTTVLKQGVII